jgi:flagellar protein FlaF
MNAQAQGKYGSYATQQREEETVRETEARALLSCARRLEEARKPGVSSEIYIDAVQHNLRLWTIFQGCLCEKDNALPRELKTLLLNLSIYVNKVSMTAITEQDPDLLKSLIDINRNIAAGLNMNPDAGRQAADDGEQISSVMTTA